MSTSPDSPRSAAQPARIQEGASSTRPRPDGSGRISGEVVRAATPASPRVVSSFDQGPPSSSLDPALARTGTRLRSLPLPEAPVRVGVLAYLASLVLAVPVGLATATMLLFVRLEEE